MTSQGLRGYESKRLARSRARCGAEKPSAFEPRDIAQELRAIAVAVRGLGPWRQDPEANAIAQDDAAHRLLRLARRLERGAP